MNNNRFSFSEQWIIAMDDDLIIVNKPSGLLTIPDGYNPDLPCLSRLLEKEFAEIWITHRLDKDTSGLVVFARTQAAHKALNLQFSIRQVKKRYTAVIFGHPSWNYLDLRLPLQVNGDRKHRTIVNIEKGKQARTEFEVKGQLEGGYSIIDATLHSGYTHQIRAHLAAIGAPILNDVLYSRTASSNTPSLPPPISRLALHASHISLIHPATKCPISYTAPFPPDLQFI